VGPVPKMLFRDIKYRLNVYYSDLELAWDKGTLFLIIITN